MTDFPTHGKLLALLEGIELEANFDDSMSELLKAKFCKEYPSISISRPDRFLDTVKRIAAPTRPSGPLLLDQVN